MGFTLEKFSGVKFKTFLICLGSFGVLFNLSNLLTDVSWFIWGLMGSGKGLYELGHVTQSLWVHPLVLWTFEYSQLTHAIRYLFVSLQPDIFLLKAWGPLMYLSFFIGIISVFSFLLLFLNKSYKLQLTNFKKSE